MTGRRDLGHKQFAAIPSATGGIARLAYARAKEAGIALPQLLADSGLTVAQIEDRHARLKVKAEITFLGLVADALGEGSVLDWCADTTCGTLASTRSSEKRGARRGACGGGVADRCSGPA